MSKLNTTNKYTKNYEIFNSQIAKYSKIRILMKQLLKHLCDEMF